MRLLSKAQYVEFKKRHQSLRPSTPEFAKVLREDDYFNALQIRFGYAVTCHKAQGGEWEQVFVDCLGRAELTEDALRWTYTAFTRASQQLFVTNVLYSPVLMPKKKTTGSSAGRDNKAAGLNVDTNHPEFWGALIERAESEQLNVRLIKAFTPYHSRYQFERAEPVNEFETVAVRI